MVDVKQRCFALLSMTTLLLCLSQNTVDNRKMSDRLVDTRFVLGRLLARKTVMRSMIYSISIISVRGLMIQGVNLLHGSRIAH